MKIDQKLIDDAIKLLENRYKSGELAGASAAYTSDGEILTSTYNKNTHAALCYETGIICEAHKRNIQITSIITILRRTDSDKILIITPCGICQERLYYWGDEMEVAVPNPQDPTKWNVKTLKEVQPFYWGKVLETKTFQKEPQV